eukprot:gene12309-5983_t
MGKKRKNKEFDENRPWCFYCDREFDDEKVLIGHQKSKHFKCPKCSKKLGSASGMATHALQCHKVSVMEVPNSKVGRDTLEYKIYGMDGIPQEFILQRLQKKRQKRQEELSLNSSSPTDDKQNTTTLEQPQIQQQPLGFLPQNFVMPQFPINFMPMMPNQQQLLNFQNPFQNIVQSPIPPVQTNTNNTIQNNTTNTIQTEINKESVKEEEEKEKQVEKNLVILLYDDDDISMEEKRSMLKQYQIINE